MSVLDDISAAAGDAYDGFQDWNKEGKETLDGPATQDPGDLTEEYLQNEGWSEEEADDAVPDNAVESISDSFGALPEASGAAYDAATTFSPEDLVPSWMQYGLVGTIILVVLAVLSYAFGQLVTVNTEV